MSLGESIRRKHLAQPECETDGDDYCDTWQQVSNGDSSDVGYGTNRYCSKACPASSILSGQRQLDFPILFERYQQQSGLWEKWESRGFCGISKGGGKRGKPAFGFPRFPPPGFFHSPGAAAFLLLKKTWIVT
jgi:hypothetical protein